MNIKNGFSILTHIFQIANHSASNYLKSSVLHNFILYLTNHASSEIVYCYLKLRSFTLGITFKKQFSSSMYLKKNAQICNLDGYLDEIILWNVCIQSQYSIKFEKFDTKRGNQLQLCSYIGMIHGNIRVDCTPIFFVVKTKYPM